MDVQIRERAEYSAKMYSHHHCLFQIRPGTIITIFVVNPNHSTKLMYDQYFFLKSGENSCINPLNTLPLYLCNKGEFLHPY